MTVAVLFARPRSVYHGLPGVSEVWTEREDARGYRGDDPVIAHPPCRAWGKYAHWVKPRPGERDLAFFAVAQVRRCGGVLEHPVGSRLWAEAGLPRPGAVDIAGGWTLRVNQCDFGHRALKPTLLYICGLGPLDIPPLPSPRPPITTVEGMGRAERERTPPDLAIWLVDLASKAQPEGPMRVAVAG